MKSFILVLFLLHSFSGYSQNTINNYKYVVVPEKYSFLKQNDQYSLNSLTKELLEDKGFTVYFDNTELPVEVGNNRCRSLRADLEKKSTMFTTSLTITLKDCQGNIVFKSKVGKSREKDYEAAYSEALKDAFTSLNKISYVDPGSTNQPVQSTATPIAAALIKEIVQPAPLKPTEVVPTPPAKFTEVFAAPVKQTVVAAPIKPTAQVTPAKQIEPPTTQQATILYAQPIPNGYQLIDSTPRIVLTLLKTSVADYFIANSGTTNGIVLKKGEDWDFEYYKDGKLVSEKLAVKF